MITLLVMLLACGPKTPAQTAMEPDPNEVGPPLAPSTFNMTSLGMLDADMEEGTIQSVKRVVHENLPEVDPCFVEYQTRREASEGRVEIEFYVKGGVVTSGQIFANTAGDSVLGKCVKSVVMEWTFPDDIEGEVISPFRLHLPQQPPEPQE